MPDFRDLDRRPLDRRRRRRRRGAVVTLLALWAPVIRGHGIPEAMEAVLTRQSRVAPRTAIAKPISAADRHRHGRPFGAEGPIIVTGGAIGSLLGQVLPVSPTERKILLACRRRGRHGGHVRRPAGRRRARDRAAAVRVLDAARSSRSSWRPASPAACTPRCSAIGPLFAVPAHDFAGLDVLPWFARARPRRAGCWPIVISRGLFFVEARLPAPAGRASSGTRSSAPSASPSSAWSCPARSASATTSSTTCSPTGSPLGTLAALAVGKLVVWWLALASGTSGGTLAPILLISSSPAALVGEPLNHVLPAGVSATSFALVAMAATFGAATRATFAAIVFVFELTRDYDAILPLMLATVLADIVSPGDPADSLMTEKLARRRVTRAAATTGPT